MKYIIFLLIFMSQFSSLVSAQDDGFFDPERDPVMQEIDGRLRFVISEALLIKSMRVRIPRIGSIEQIEKKQFQGFWYIMLESRHAADLDQSVVVALRLRKDDQGNYFADHAWQACTGEGCGGCGWDSVNESCFCKFDRPGEPGTPGACYHSWSDEALLMRVPIKD